MRKLLLASAAMLGATAGIASAQAPVPATSTLMMQPSQGMIALPWNQGPTPNNNNNAYGQPSTYAGAAAYGKNAVPTPGTVVIRLNGRLQTEVKASWSTNHQVPGFKTNAVDFGTYIRLYPGVDGMATNGLRYGAAVELRENFPGNSATLPTIGGTAATASATTSALGAAAPVPGTYNSGQTIYVKRAFAYIAADNVGILRMGTQDGIIGLFDPGIFRAAGWDGGVGELNGASVQSGGVNGAYSVPYVLAGVGADYTSTKLVYLSPQIFGLDVGFEYGPSMGNGYSACNNAAFGCDQVTTGNDPTRWFNKVAVGARWQGTFGPVSPGLYIAWGTASKEAFAGGPATDVGRGFNGTRYDNLNFISAGAYLLVDTGVGTITGSGTYVGGDMNGNYVMKPTGGISMDQYLVGLVYRNGPLALGSQFEFVNSQGAAVLTKVSQRREFALAVGGSYVLAPGLNVYAEYQYEFRHQGGFDFVTGTVSAAAAGSGPAGSATWRPGTTRDAHGQGITAGFSVSW